MNYIVNWSYGSSKQNFFVSCKGILKNSLGLSNARIYKTFCREFWLIIKKVLNREKSSVLTILPEVISSDKFKLFVMIFTSNSPLNNQGNLLLDFPPLTSHKLCDLTLSSREVFRHIKNLNSINSAGSDTIPINEC